MLTICKQCSPEKSSQKSAAAPARPAVTCAVSALVACWLGQSVGKHSTHTHQRADSKKPRRRGRRRSVVTCDRLLTCDSDRSHIMCCVSLNPKPQTLNPSMKCTSLVYHTLQDVVGAGGEMHGVPQHQLTVLWQPVSSLWQTKSGKEREDMQRLNPSYYTTQALTVPVPPKPPLGRRALGPPPCLAPCSRPRLLSLNDVPCAPSASRTREHRHVCTHARVITGKFAVAKARACSLPNTLIHNAQKQAAPPLVHRLPPLAKRHLPTPQPSNPLPNACTMPCVTDARTFGSLC